MLLIIAMVVAMVPAMAFAGEEDQISFPVLSGAATGKSLSERLADLDTDLADGFQWPEGTDPADDIAALGALADKYATLTEAYGEVMNEVPGYEWPNGDPNAQGGEIQQLAAAYNEYYADVEALIAAAEEKKAELVLYNEEHAQYLENKAAYDEQLETWNTAVSDFSDALASDIFNSTVTKDPEPKGSGVVGAGIWDLRTARIPKLLEQLSTSSGSSLDTSASVLFDIDKTETVNRIVPSATGLAYWIKDTGVSEITAEKTVTDRYLSSWSYKEQTVKVTAKAVLSETTKANAGILSGLSAPGPAPSEPEAVDFSGLTAADDSAAQAAFADAPAESPYARAMALIGSAIKLFATSVVCEPAATGTVYFARNGESKSFTLSLSYVPTDGGADADFDDIAWDVKCDGVAKAAAEGDTLTVSVEKDAVGTGDVTVGAHFNSPGVYNKIIVTPLTISVEAVDTIVFDGPNPCAATADSTNADTAISLPPVKNAIGSVDYELKGIEPAEAHGRISFDGSKIKVAKDANAGQYAVTVAATDSKGFTAETTIDLTVTNANDAKYNEQLAKLQDIEDQINDILAMIDLLPDGSVDQTYIDELRTFADVTAPLESMWNDGDPQIDKNALKGLSDALKAIGKVDASLSTATNAAASIIDGLSDVLVYLPVNKDTAVNGYYYMVPVFNREIIIPSLPTLYVSAVAGAWDIFQKQITPVTSVINAYSALQNYVTAADYKGLTDIDSVNAYIQGLYARYAALDDALVAFRNSDSIFVGLADSVLEHANDLVIFGIGAAKGAGRTALSAALDPYIDEYITDPELNATIKDYIDEAFDAVAAAAEEQAAQLPDSLSLDDILGLSARIRAALSDLSAASALITGAYRMGSEFDIAQYDLLQIDMLGDYLLDIYETYLGYATGAAGTEGPNAQELRDRIEALKARLQGNPTYAEAVDIYNQIVEIYGYVNKAIEYFSSDQPQRDFEAAKAQIIRKLEELRDRAIEAGKAELARRIKELIERIKAELDKRKPTGPAIEVPTDSAIDEPTGPAIDEPTGSAIDDETTKPAIDTETSEPAINGDNKDDDKPATGTDDNPAPGTGDTQVTVAEADLAAATITLKGVKKGRIAWTGKRLKPVVTVTCNGTAYRQDADYTVRYGKNKKLGAALVTVTAVPGGKLSGAQAVTFNIVPPRPVIKSVKTGSNSFAVKFKKVTRKLKVTKYRLYYRAKDRKNAGEWHARTVMVKYGGKQTVSLKIAGKYVKKGKKYDVRIRAYKKSGPVGYYSPFSKTGKTASKVR